jgi:hypothetical protein
MAHHRGSALYHINPGGEEQPSAGATAQLSNEFRKKRFLWGITGPGLIGLLPDILAQSSSIGFGVSNVKGELRPCAGINTVSLALAPPGKRARVDIDAENDVSLILIKLLRFLRSFGEALPSRREIFAVFEDRDEGVVIFLAAPRNADGR